MGEKLISGSGKGIPKIGTNWATAIALAIVFIVAGFLIAGQVGYDVTRQLTWGLQVTVVYVRSPFYYVIVGLGFLWALISIVVCAARNSIIQKTEITVYEMGISGTGVHPKFSTDFFSPEKYATSTFSYAFEQISAVSVMETLGTSLAINVQGKEHLVATKNANEIAEVINGKIQSKRMNEDGGKHEQ